MNKLSLIANGVVIAISMVGIAHAKLNNWTGIYAGMNSGYAFNHIQLKSQQLGFTDPSGTCNTSSDFSTFFPGMQLGYMQQFSNHMLAGIEVNGTVNINQKNTFGCNSDINSGVYDRFSFRNQMQGSIKGRVGRALTGNDGVLPYLTVGASLANVDFNYYNEGGDFYAKNIAQTGWLVGAGIEWAFRQNWSLRAEYSYIGYGKIKLHLPSVYELLDPNGKARVNVSSNNVAVAINYWV